MRDGSIESTATQPPGSSREPAGRERRPGRPRAGTSRRRRSGPRRDRRLEGDRGGDGAERRLRVLPVAGPASGPGHGRRPRLRRRVRPPDDAGPDPRLLEPGGDPRQHRIRPGRDALRGRDPHGVVPSPPGRPREIPGGSGPGRDGDRELPRRAAARCRGGSPGPLGGLRRAAASGRAPPVVHLPDLRHQGGRGARAVTGREEARRERCRYRDLYEEAPNAYVAVGADRRLSSVNHRATQLLGEGAADLVGRPCSSSSPRPRPAGPGPRRCSEPASTARRSPVASWRCAAATASAVGELLDEAAAWPRRPDLRRPFHLGLRHRPGPRRGRAARLQEQNLYLQEEIKSVHNFEEIVGCSAALLAVLDKVRPVAATDATVLITGETGTGKELIARAVHSNSRRAARPLIKLNCAALPGGLVESELFGHEKGAFTGALARRIGRFELADGGTLFLDEIAELPRRPKPSCSASSKSMRSSASAAGGDPGRRPDHRRHQSRPAQGRPREDVPRGSLLSPQRLSRIVATTPRARRGHPAAGALPRPPVRRPGRQALRGSEPGDRGSPVQLSVAGEYPRAGERARAGHHPRDRSGPRFRDRWRTPSSLPPRPRA